MKTAVELAMQRGPSFTVPRVWGYDAPFSKTTLAEWQRQLDAEFYRGERGSRLLIRWEASEPWQTLDRLMLWIGVDPRYVEIEPWVRKALYGPSPRSKGHYCAPGYCLCEQKQNRWVGGATKFLDSQTWRIYRETGLYATRWWIIQGSRGGHRYRWDQEELAAVVANMKGLGNQPPAVGGLPYAPFDARVLRAIRAEHKASRAAAALKDMAGRKLSLALEDRDQAEAVAKALWDWTGDQAEALWHEGADAIPIVAEMEYGRAPIGHQIDTRYDELAERCLSKPLE